MNRIVRPLKVTVVGDSKVGKTCLIVSHIFGAWIDPEIKCVSGCQDRTRKLNVDGRGFSLTIWDTKGSEENEKIRPLSYLKTDCFIVCYDVNNRHSFKNVESKWMPELKHHCPKTACILVGTKSDIKTQLEDRISFQEQKKMKSKIKTVAFLECLAKKCKNFNDVFVEATRAAMKNAEKHRCRFL